MVSRPGEQPGVVPTVQSAADSVRRVCAPLLEGPQVVAKRTRSITNTIVLQGREQDGGGLHLYGQHGPRPG
jgi:hypothetical protein